MNRWFLVDEFKIGDDSVQARLQFSPLTVVFRVSVSEGLNTVEEVFCIQDDSNLEPISILTDGASAEDKKVARFIANKLLNELRLDVK